jgi:hypothetical protein
MIKLELFPRRHASAHSDFSFSLNILVLYEDFTAGLQAKEWLDRLAHQLEYEAEFDANLWRFDVLRAPAFAEHAISDAAKADIIVLSAHTGVGLLAPVGEWLNQCLRLRANQSTALVVLLEGDAADQEDNRPLLANLKALAQRANVALFYQCFEARGPDWNWSLGRMIERAEQSSTVLEEILHRGV